MESSNLEDSKVLSLYIADAFTKYPFSGNSAAEIGNDAKQKIASEMNLSETAFVKIIKQEDSFQTGKRFSLDWFTPLCQVPLCGHATLASAAVLFIMHKNVSEILEFETVSGILKAKKLPKNQIEIDLPAYNSNKVNGKYDKIIKAVVKNLPVEDAVMSSSRKLLIRLCDTVTRKELEVIKVNDAELLSLDKDIMGVIVTLKGSRKDCLDEEGRAYDFISRYFAPWFGISEDPVTGSAHSVLAPFWSNILNKKAFMLVNVPSRRRTLH